MNQQFDTGREIGISIPGPTGKKTAVLRWPTDVEWAERAAAQKIITRMIGRDQSTTEVIGAEAADLALFAAIRKDDGEAWDQFEAAIAISKISKAVAGLPEMDGATYIIPLVVAGTETKHILRVPSVGQMTQYRRASARVIEGRHGLQEIRVKLQPAAELYDVLAVSVEGYASPVPIIHKVAVLNEMLREIDAAIEGDEGF